MYKRVLLFILPIFVLFACSVEETPEKETGYLTLNVSQGIGTKSGVEIADFILRISDGQVEMLKERISELPEQISLPVGTYTVEAYSADFSEPKFETPVYSGKTTVEIVANVSREVSLICSQSNAGVRVVWSSDFPLLYGTYQAKIHCDAGYLNYTSTETRTGYFLPGTVSISILADGLTINGGTFTLAAKDMVTANLRPKYSPSGNLYIDIEIDETVNERDIEIIIDTDDVIEFPNSETNPYNIAQAIAKQGETAVWISGYIVGAKPATTSDYNFAIEQK
jgi:hypothetical protein